MTWLVVLTKQPPMLYPPGYFPRKFETKDDAMAVMTRIQAEGGEAQLTVLEFYTANEGTKQ